MASDFYPIGGRQKQRNLSPQRQVPLRTIAMHVNEGDDPDQLRSAFELGADAVFFDLEDHVPRPKLAVARRNIRTVLDESGGCEKILVRVNRTGRPETLDDLDAIVCPGLYGVVIPKVQHPEEIRFVDRLLSIYEERNGVEIGSTLILPLLETAQGVRLAYEIAAVSPRVGYLGGCLNQHGDPARSIRYQWTRDMDESIYIRQKVLLDARAAGVLYPMSGVWNPAQDLEGLEKFAVNSRNIGYSGLLVLPLPEHIALVNRVFTPSQDEIDYWAEIVGLMEAVNTDDVMPDLVVGGQVVPENRLLWGRLRLELAGHYGVTPSPDRPKLVADSIGSASAHWRDLASMGSDRERLDR
jgi:citrate lyase subunit beta/citryl-CoA lyase